LGPSGIFLNIMEQRQERFRFQVCFRQDRGVQELSSGRSFGRRVFEIRGNFDYFDAGFSQKIQPLSDILAPVAEVGTCSDDYFGHRLRGY